MEFLPAESVFTDTITAPNPSFEVEHRGTRWLITKQIDP
jgi:hypothetical protein